MTSVAAAVTRLNAPACRMHMARRGMFIWWRVAEHLSGGWVDVRTHTSRLSTGVTHFTRHVTPAVFYSTRTQLAA